MAEIIDLINGFPGTATEFDLMYRQELSRTAGGSTIAIDHGRPLFKGSWQSISLRPSDLALWRARLNSLGGAIGRFSARPINCYPWAHPNGEDLGDVSNIKISAIKDNREVTFSGLPEGIIFTVGDYHQVGDFDLYQVIKVIGKTVIYAPALSARNKVGDKVTVIRPACVMGIVPGTIRTSASSNGWGTVSFDGIEVRV